MKLDFRRCAVWIGALALALHAAAASAAQGSGLGFLAVASDRGFQGNEEIRDAFDEFAAGRNAELVFATDERTRGMLGDALARLAQRGADRLVVLPVFLSAGDPAFALVKGYLAGARVPIVFARAFGESYFAVEALADRLRTIPNPAGARVVIAGYGARDADTRKRLEQDLERIAVRAAEGLDFARVQALVWYDGRAPQREARRAEAMRALGEPAQGATRTWVVPFHLGRRLDSMMSYEAELKSALAAGSELFVQGPGPEALLATWMKREANRYGTLEPKDIGVIVLAHGSDLHWNEAIRQAAKPLEARHPVEYVFSMADQPLVERAVRRLEKRGARAAVIVRVFGRTDSLRREVERMIGADIERAPEGAPQAEHAGMQSRADGMAREAMAVAAVRIRSTLPIVTVGGIEADPLFAQVLLERAKELSKDPSRETVILVAHGNGGDAENERWLQLLEALAGQMRANGGAKFKAFRVATWREDWPEQRAEWIGKVRGMVEEASRDGGRALVIPARVNGRGPEREYLKGLDFELGSGFVPHPLFARWVDRQIEAGIAALDPREAGAVAFTGHGSGAERN